MFGFSFFAKDRELLEQFYAEEREQLRSAAQRHYEKSYKWARRAERAAYIAQKAIEAQDERAYHAAADAYHLAHYKASNHQKVADSYEVEAIGALPLYEGATHEAH